MNKLKYFITIILLFAFKSYSDQVTINISGNVLEKTCEISQSSGDNLLVDMGLIDYRFHKSEAIISDTIFSIDLENCSNNISLVTVSFTGESDDTYPDKLKIRHNEGDAEGIAISLENISGDPIDIRNNSTKFELFDSSENVKLSFMASLFTTLNKQLTPGKIYSVAYFEISYE